MTPADILSHVDHTLLKPEATAADIEALCSEALRCSVASVCVNPTVPGFWAAESLFAP